MERGSFRGDEVVVDGLPSGEKGDLGTGAGGGEDLQSALGLLLGDVLAVVDGDELGVLLGLGLGQALEQSGEIPIGAEELVFGQGQVVPLLDIEAVKVGVPGGVGDLGGVDWVMASVLSSWMASGSKESMAETPWGMVLVGRTTTVLPWARGMHCSAAMMMFLLLGRT